MLNHVQIFNKNHTVKLACVVLISAGLLFSAFPSPAASKEIKVGMSENPPLAFSENSEYKGLSNDIIKYVADEEGWSLRFVPCKWARCLEMLENGETDIQGGIAYTAKREKIYDFTKETLFYNWGQIYSQPNVKLETVLSLKGRKLVLIGKAVHSIAFVDLLRKFDVAPEIIDVKDYSALINVLNNKGADAGVFSRTAAIKFMRHVKLNKSPIIFNPVEVRYAVLKGRNKDILSAIDRHISLLKKDSDSLYYRSLDSLFGNTKRYGIPKWLIGGALIISSALLLSVLIAVLLRRQVKSKTAEILESEEKYRSIFNEARDGIVLSNTETGLIVDCNAEFLRQAGRKLEQLKGMRIWEIRPPEKVKLAKAKFMEIRDSGAGGSNELDIQKPDGEIVPIEFSSKVVSIRGENYNQSISRDITDRKKAEEELKQKSRHMQTMLDALPCFAVILTSDREIVALNNVARQMGGDIGKTCFKSMAPFDKPCPWCQANLALEKNEFQNTKTWGLGIYWDAYWIPLEKDLCLHFAFDITESKKAEEKIAASLKEKEVLLREVHHRVKNNMAVISSLLSLQSGYINEKKYLDMFKESVSRIKSMALVHEKLYQTEDFARIDVWDYIETLAKNIKSTFAGNADIATWVEVQDIYLDIDALIPCGLIINEILTNSFKHAFDGLDSPEIRVSLNKAGDDNVVLAISDNGKGFPDGFDMDKTAGLGLKLVKILVTQINGKLEVKSENGVLFTITFPLTMQHARHLPGNG